MPRLYRLRLFKSNPLRSVLFLLSVQIRLICVISVLINPWHPLKSVKSVCLGPMHEVHPHCDTPFSIVKHCDPKYPCNPFKSVKSVCLCSDARSASTLIKSVCLCSDARSASTLGTNVYVHMGGAHSPYNTFYFQNALYLQHNRNKTEK